MKKIILAILISNVSTVFLIEKRSEHFVQDQAGKFEFDLPSDFGERIRKREYFSEPTVLIRHGPRFWSCSILGLGPDLYLDRTGALSEKIKTSNPT